MHIAMYYSYKNITVCFVAFLTYKWTVEGIPVQTTSLDPRYFKLPPFALSSKDSYKVHVNVSSLATGILELKIIIYFCTLQLYSDFTITVLILKSSVFSKLFLGNFFANLYFCLLYIFFC